MASPTKASDDRGLHGANSKQRTMPLGPGGVFQLMKKGHFRVPVTLSQLPFTGVSLSVNLSISSKIHSTATTGKYVVSQNTFHACKLCTPACGRFFAVIKLSMSIRSKQVIFNQNAFTLAIRARPLPSASGKYLEKLLNGID
jgi:hypothetical protein